MVVRSKCLLRSFFCFSLTICVVMIIIGINIMSSSDYDMLALEYGIDNPQKDPHDEKRASAAIEEVIDVPVVIWWTPFTGERGQIKKCGDVECFFTQDRHYRHHAQTTAFLFYGTDFKVLDLPLPRKADEDWALLHEESPKNLYLLSHEGVMSLFNHTGTFSRHSNLPLTTQYLPSIEWLEDDTFVVPTSEKTRLQTSEGLAPFIYTHSDCDPPSDRDSFVRMLMEHIKVDSYGKCVHNKDLPKNLQDPLEGMDHHEFYMVQAKYKFSLAFENGICDDYITEKVWRPFKVGSVPVIMGSPKIKDFLPGPNSAILLQDFASLEDFVTFMKKLNEDDKEYDKYLKWKKTGVTNKYLLGVMADREWGINNDPTRPNFIDSFECMVCKRIHKNNAMRMLNKPKIVYRANQSHYGCPRPEKYDASIKQVFNQAWGAFYDSAGEMAQSLNYFVQNNIMFNRNDLYDKAFSFKQRQLQDLRDLF